MPDENQFILPELNLVRCGPRGESPVLLLHAVGLDLGFWDRQIEALSDCHDVVAVDLPGHGRSPGGPEDCTLERMSGVVADLIRVIDSGPAHVVGLSAGGMIAQALTLAEPTLVRSLALIDTAASFEDPGRDVMRQRARDARAGGMSAVLRSAIGHWFTPYTVAARPHIVDRATKTLLRDDPLFYAAMWDMIAELDLVADLQHIRCPTLILVGEQDTSSPPSAARQLHDGIAGSVMHVIPAAAHMSPLEHPGVINGYLRSFFHGVKCSSDLERSKG